MTKLANITAYLCTHYPHKKELSKARLTKLVYLSDWFFSLTKEEQMSDIKWIFNHYGPYVDDISNIAYNNDNFNIQSTITKFGTDKYLITYIGKNEDIELDEQEIKILDFVIKKTKNLYFDEFIDYVYSTYPIKSKQRYSTLNLVELAKEYKKLKE